MPRVAPLGVLPNCMWRTPIIRPLGFKYAWRGIRNYAFAGKLPVLCSWWVLTVVDGQQWRSSHAKCLRVKMSEGWQKRATSNEFLYLILIRYKPVRKKLFLHNNKAAVRPSACLREQRIRKVKISALLAKERGPSQVMFSAYRHGSIRRFDWHSLII